MGILERKPCFMSISSSYRHIWADLVRRRIERETTRIYSSLFGRCGDHHRSVGTALAASTRNCCGGKLFPANDPTPRNACDGRNRSDIPKDAILIVAGTSASFMSLKGKVTALQLGRCPMVQVQKAEGGLLIDADVFDAAGKLAGHVENNAYEAIEGTDSHTDRRGDLSTLFIIGKGDKELFYIRYINQTTIRIRGTFYCQQSQSKKITITDDAIEGFTRMRLCLFGSGVPVAIKVP